MTYQIEPIMIEKSVKRFSYLLMTNETNVLIDPGAKHHKEALLEGVLEHVAIHALDYIILQSNDYLNVPVVEVLKEEGFKGQVIAYETGLSYLKDILDVEVLSIEGLNYKLSIGDEDSLSFIPMPFMPFPEGFVTFFNTGSILFSSHLFSHQAEPNDKVESVIAAINHFHEMTLPSVEFLRESMRKIKHLMFDKIYPRLGCAIEKTSIHAVFSSVLRYDFYNTNQVIDHVNNKNVSYNYETICNHMLKRLESKYHRKTILDVFKDTDIHLGMFPHLEIEKTTLKKYKLWHAFFDTIYQKKGITWLTLLEPLVKKYHKMYNINLPTIYNTKWVEMQSKIKGLDTSKKALEEEITQLESKISETTDLLLRCPITKLYNQHFMIGHLLSHINDPLDKGMTRSLLLIQIDNLQAINKKHGTHKGNETLKRLVHVIESIKHKESLIFKQNGPGLFIYKHAIDESAVIQTAETISNHIKESDLFVEKISVSISIVTIEELNERYDKAERVNQFIELAQMRLERAKLKGIDQVIDKHSDQDVYTEGLILLVDEDETYQNLMVKLFKRVHYDVLIAKDIYQGYQYLENHNIDIIISEINLSKLDGFQFKQTINQSRNFKDIPFIIVSHHKNLEVIKRCNYLDVDLILQKPIMPEELIGHIKRYRKNKVVLT